MNKITHVAWLNGGCIAVVKVNTEYNRIKYYISAVGQQSTYACFAHTEEGDAVKAAHWGNSLDPEVGEMIITKLGKPFELEYM